MCIGNIDKHPYSVVWSPSGLRHFINSSPPGLSMASVRSSLGNLGECIFLLRWMSSLKGCTLISDLFKDLNNYSDVPRFF
jgi:hypothetical protein